MAKRERTFGTKKYWKAVKRGKFTKTGNRYSRKKQVSNLRLAKVGLGFPKNMMMTNKYTEIVQLSFASAQATATTYNFVCNSLYDPNQSSTGHQPLYFDQLMALYDHYTVIGAKMTVKFYWTSSNQPPAVVGCFINDDPTSTSAVPSTLMENSNVQHRIMGLNQQTPVEFTMKWSAKKAFPGSTLANANLQGNAAASPAEIQCFTLFLSAADGASATSAFAEVNIEYISIYNELKDIAGS